MLPKMPNNPFRMRFRSTHSERIVRPSNILVRRLAADERRPRMHRRAHRLAVIAINTNNEPIMWTFWEWYQYREPTDHPRPHHRGVISSIYLLQFIRPGDKLDTARWAIMKPSWETTRLRNRMKEHRHSTISSLRALLDETIRMMGVNPCLSPLLKHAWGSAVCGVGCLVATYDTDAQTALALREIMVHIQRLLQLPEDGPTPYPPQHLAFMSLLFPGRPSSPLDFGHAECECVQ